MHALVVLRMSILQHVGKLCSNYQGPDNAYFRLLGPGGWWLFFWFWPGLGL